MEFYIDSEGQVKGRLYKCGDFFVGEIGRKTNAVMCGFIATKGIKSESRKACEKFLFDNGCVSAAEN